MILPINIIAVGTKNKKKFTRFEYLILVKLKSIITEPESEMQKKIKIPSSKILKGVNCNDSGLMEFKINAITIGSNPKIELKANHKSERPKSFKKKLNLILLF